MAIPQITTMQEYEDAYKQSIEAPDQFWEKIAESFSWRKKWNKVHSGDFSNLDFKWFEGGKLNITENCLDRHLESNGDKAALIWEPNEPGEEYRTLSYKELHAEVCKFANVLKKHGVKKEIVCAYICQWFLNWL